MAKKQQFKSLNIELKETVEVKEDEWVDGGRQQQQQIMVSPWEQVVGNAAFLTVSLRI